MLSGGWVGVISVIALCLPVIADLTVKTHGEVEVAEEGAGEGRHNL